MVNRDAYRVVIPAVRAAYEKVTAEWVERMAEKDVRAFKEGG